MHSSPISAFGRAAAVHPLQFLWEPLADDPTFLLRPMFGGKAAYLDGRMVLYFCAKEEPWRGVFVGTGRGHHATLRAEFPALVPHPVLSKWLYLSEAHDDFETVAAQLVRLARARDPRIGVAPRPKKRRGGTRTGPQPRPC